MLFFTETKHLTACNPSLPLTPGESPSARRPLIGVLSPSVTSWRLLAAPAPVSSEPKELVMGKKRGQSGKESGHSEDNLPRSAANARERTRMRVLSKSFERLKLTLPWVPADTKLSKLDTLRLAMTYINHLHSLLLETDSDTQEDTTSLSVKRSWPYNHPTTNLLSSNMMTDSGRFEDNNNKMETSFLPDPVTRRRKVSEIEVSLFENIFRLFNREHFQQMSEEFQSTNPASRSSESESYSHWLERN